MMKRKMRSDRSPIVISVAQLINRPNISLCASWNSTGLVLAHNTTFNTSTFSIFINTENNIYIANRFLNFIRIWKQDNDNSIETISGNWNSLTSLFVTNGGDIYMDSNTNDQVDKWSLNTRSSVTIKNIYGGCISLFIDINNTLYCSINKDHQVVKAILHGNYSKWMAAAGTGCAGLSPYMLNQPNGIFVDTNFDLYVADTENNRIQKFTRRHQRFGVTLISNTTANFPLNRPTSVILDAEGYLFIVDSGNHRIIRSLPNRFQCLIGCSDTPCTTSDSLCQPRTIAFDTVGNLYVTDMNNQRVQKYLLARKSCGK